MPEPGQVGEIALELLAGALRALGQESISPNGRNYYLTQARELEGKARVEEDRTVDERTAAFVSSIPIRNFMLAMPIALDAEKAADADVVVGFRFEDVDEDYTVHVRRGVAEIETRAPEAPDISVRTEASGASR